ncbi:hypothetical protein PFLmoz3_03940 [Pseudomonas fluorescens]|uniref:Uncharacterized protein n=1 Tax=Pseudomonas fluorescens TaxID=294 RepID=A0A109LER5_PSEFL|nr:hypothetical protein PFLmoz3_03940 [Pseudomonas fluorescens]
MVPISTKRAAWRWEIPSRSIKLVPLAATSSSRSTKWSASRLTSSTYNTPPSALANTPGENCARPSPSAASRSRVPTRRSSVAPRGKVTN